MFARPTPITVPGAILPDRRRIISFPYEFNHVDLVRSESDTGHLVNDLARIAKIRLADAQDRCGDRRIKACAAKSATEAWAAGNMAAFFYFTLVTSILLAEELEHENRIKAGPPPVDVDKITTRYF